MWISNKPCCICFTCDNPLWCIASPCVLQLYRVVCFDQNLFIDYLKYKEKFLGIQHQNLFQYYCFVCFTGSSLFNLIIFWKLFHVRVKVYQIFCIKVGVLVNLNFFQIYCRLMWKRIYTSYHTVRNQITSYCNLN